MSKLEYQIVRNGVGRWLIWRPAAAFKTPDGHGREYEEVARVVEDRDGNWYVERPQWSDDGVDSWDREPRPWLTKDGAVRSVTHPKTKMAS